MTGDIYQGQCQTRVITAGSTLTEFNKMKKADSPTAVVMISAMSHAEYIAAKAESTGITTGTKDGLTRFNNNGYNPTQTGRGPGSVPRDCPLNRPDLV